MHQEACKEWNSTLVFLLEDLHCNISITQYAQDQGLARMRDNEEEAVVL